MLCETCYKNKCNEERSEATRKANGTEHAQPDSKTNFRHLRKEEKSKQVAALRVDRIKQKRQIVSLKKQIDVLQRNMISSVSSRMHDPNLAQSKATETRITMTQLKIQFPVSTIHSWTN
jgi:hypothetical protein